MAFFDAIYADVLVGTDGDLPGDIASLLKARLGGETSTDEALAQTIFADAPGIAATSVLYARMTPELVYFVYADEVGALRAHVQRRFPSTVSDVKRSAEEIADRLVRFAKYHRLRIREEKIILYASKSHLQTGTPTSTGDRFKRALRADAPALLAIPVVALLLSAIWETEAARAAFNGLVAFVALFFRSAATAALTKTEVEYA
jgi:hypothetical protein